jgi:hypothetical protein
VSSRREHVVLATGLVALALYVAQAIWWQWPALAALQHHPTYKLATGALLLVYLRAQWVTGRRRIDAAALFRHRLAGALAPLMLYLHAVHIGYGYLALLVAVYLGTAMAGLAYPLALRRRWLYTTWFIVHLVAATALLALVAYHVVIALAY